MAKKKEKAEELIIDGNNAILGRLASFVAKKALSGEKINIVNSEKILVSGSEKNVLKRYLKKRARGGSIQKGPFFPRQPERILRRTIRNMLPYKKNRGKEAYKRIRCYLSVPKKFEGKKFIKSSRKNAGVSLKKIAKRIGWQNE